MAYENLTYERNGAVLTVRLNRPGKMNSSSRGLLLDSRVRGGPATTQGCARWCSPGPAAASAPARTSRIRTVRLLRASRWGQWVSARLRNHLQPGGRALVSPARAAGRSRQRDSGRGRGVARAAGGRNDRGASAAFAVLFTPKLGLVPDMGATYLLPAGSAMRAPDTWRSPAARSALRKPSVSAWLRNAWRTRRFRVARRGACGRARLRPYRASSSRLRGPDRRGCLAHARRSARARGARAAVAGRHPRLPGGHHGIFAKAPAPFPRHLALRRPGPQAPRRGRRTWRRRSASR